jgi:hypothetical protein
MRELNQQQIFRQELKSFDKEGAIGQMRNDNKKDKKLTDIDLCYQALGLSIGDSPAKIEEAYARLTAVYKKDLSSPEPAVRENAKNSIALMTEMYGKIARSVTYKAMLKEQDRIGRNETRTPNADMLAMKSSLILCPSCNTLIGKGFKICPRCKHRFYTKTEKFVEQYLTIKIITLFFLIVLTGIMVYIGLMYPDRVTELLGSLRR